MNVCGSERKRAILENRNDCECHNLYADQIRTRDIFSKGRPFCDPEKL